MPDTPTLQHTPGPWEAATTHRTPNAINDWFCVVHAPAKTGAPHAPRSAEALGITKAEATANAQLIAAAPDLLAAGLELVRTIDTMPDDTERGRILRCALNNRAGDMLREAIAKATT